MIDLPHHGWNPSLARRGPAQAEFDLLADDYEKQHKANIAITGEGPAFFAEYKIADLASFAKSLGLQHTTLLDFGSGIGNSIPYFRSYFPSTQLQCADVSTHSMDIARARFPGSEAYVVIQSAIGLPSRSQDISFSACVFHHIPHDEHVHWLSELRRVTRPGGLMAIYEHNPLNPLTLRAVNTCPLDVNARLITARTLRKRALAAGWVDVAVEYKLFFPSFLRRLRPLEKRLDWLPLGAQYRLAGRVPT
jgi:SAM-dependent methyltransferase